MVCTTGFGLSLAVEDCIIIIASGKHNLIIISLAQFAHYLRYKMVKTRSKSMSVWSSGMIPALGAGGPGFKPRNGPFCFFPDPKAKALQLLFESEVKKPFDETQTKKSVKRVMAALPSNVH